MIKYPAPTVCMFLSPTFLRKDVIDAIFFAASSFKMDGTVMLNLATPYFFQFLFGQFFEIMFCIFHDMYLFDKFLHFQI